MIGRLSDVLKGLSDVCSRWLLPQVPHLSRLSSALSKVEDPDGDLGLEVAVAAIEDVVRSIQRKKRVEL